MVGDAPSEPERLEQSALDRFTRHLFFLGSLASFMAMVLLIALDTILRYFFNAPIFGAQEVVGLGVIGLIALVVLIAFGVPLAFAITLVAVAGISMATIAVSRGRSSIMSIILLVMLERSTISTVVIIGFPLSLHRRRLDVETAGSWAGFAGSPDRALTGRIPSH